MSAPVCSRSERMRGTIAVMASCLVALVVDCQVDGARRQPVPPFRCSARVMPGSCRRRSQLPAFTPRRLSSALTSLCRRVGIALSLDLHSNRQVARQAGDQPPRLARRIRQLRCRRRAQLQLGGRPHRRSAATSAPGHGRKWSIGHKPRRWEAGGRSVRAAATAYIERN